MNSEIGVIYDKNDAREIRSRMENLSIKHGFQVYYQFVEPYNEGNDKVIGKFYLSENPV